MLFSVNKEIARAFDVLMGNFLEILLRSFSPPAACLGFLVMGESGGGDDSLTYVASGLVLSYSFFNHLIIMAVLGVMLIIGGNSMST